MTTYAIQAFTYVQNSDLSALGYGTLSVSMPDGAPLNYSYAPWVQSGVPLTPDDIATELTVSVATEPLTVQFSGDEASGLPFDDYLFDLAWTDMFVFDVVWGDGAYRTTVAAVTDFGTYSTTLGSILYGSSGSINADVTTMFVLDGDPLPQFGSFTEVASFFYASSVSLYPTGTQSAAPPDTDIDMAGFSESSREEDEVYDLTGTGRTIATGEGADIIAGFGGADVIDAGAGHDIVTYALDIHMGGENGIVVTMDLGEVQDGFGDLDTLSGVEQIRGTDLADHVDAGASALIFEGLDGDDMFLAGSGDTVFLGGAGRDRLSYANDTTGIFVDMSRGLAKGAETGRDRFEDVEEILGSAGADFVVARSGADLFLSGLDGNDIIKFKETATGEIHGGGGSDKLVGAEGNDQLFGGADDDRLFGIGGNDQLFGGAGSDYLYGGRDMDVLFGGTGDDFLRGNRGDDDLHGEEGADDLRGGAGDDRLFGGADGDFLLGEGGSDRLDGGAGDDTLVGGFGAGVLDGLQDTFVYADSAAGSGGFDRIRDFEDGIDVIDLAAFGFTDFLSEVAGLASDTTFGMRLDFGGGDVLFLDGFFVSQFDAGDVVL